MNYLEKNLDQKVKAEQERFEKLFNYAGVGKLTHWKEFVRKWKERKKDEKPIRLGLSELDYYLDGILPGEVTVITGLFGNGKTLFTKTLAKDIGEQGHAIGIFTFEDQAMSYLKSFDEIDPDGKTFNFYLPEENTPGNFRWLEDRIIECKIKYNAKVAFIDHLHYIVDMGGQKLHQDISIVMRRLVVLAMELDIAIMLVCHQKSLPEQKTEPSLYTCRDSSAIPQECANGIVVHRMKDFDDKTEFDSYDMGYAFVKIDKARRAGTYRKKLTFQKKGEWLCPI